jgi:predicted membrane channel-forming protein YqfA (hemolysin III family)
VSTSHERTNARRPIPWQWAVSKTRTQLYAVISFFRSSHFLNCVVESRYVQLNKRKVQDKILIVCDHVAIQTQRSDVERAPRPD